MAETDTVKVGVIGCGAIAQLVHLPILSGTTGVRVAAVCDTDVAKAERVADRFEIPSFCRTVEELLEKAEVQAAIVCTPNPFHAEHAELSLRAGLDVLCERPLGTSQEQVAQTLRVAKETGHNLMVANNHRYRPDAWTLRTFIARGELGEIFHVQATWQRRRARRPRVSEWRRSRERGSGVLMDLGVTNLDLCLWLLGYPKPERLSAYLLDRDGDRVDDTAVVLMRLEGNLTCSVEVSWDLAAIRDRHSLVALGARGFGSLSPFIVQRETNGSVSDVTPRIEPASEPVYRASYRRELDYFLGVVRKVRTEPLPEEQVVLMGIVDACYRSTEEGREIVL